MYHISEVIKNKRGDPAIFGVNHVAAMDRQCGMTSGYVSAQKDIFS